MKRAIYNKGYLGIMVILLLCFCRPSASGQDTQLTTEPLISNTLGFGVTGGWSVCKDALRGAPQLQFLARIRLGAILGLEGMVGYVGEQQFHLSTSSGEQVTAAVHRIPLTASLILFIPLAPTFTPYLVGGLGAHYMILDYSAEMNETIPDKSQTRFGYHLGAGLEIPLNQHVALLGDYRYLYVDDAFEKELQVDFSSAEYRSSLFSAGVVVYF